MDGRTEPLSGPPRDSPAWPRLCTWCLIIETQFGSSQGGVSLKRTRKANEGTTRAGGDPERRTDWGAAVHGAAGKRHLTGPAIPPSSVGHRGSAGTEEEAGLPEEGATVPTAQGQRVVSPFPSWEHARGERTGGRGAQSRSWDRAGLAGTGLSVLGPPSLPCPSRNFPPGRLRPRGGCIIYLQYSMEDVFEPARAHLQTSFRELLLNWKHRRMQSIFSSFQKK